jgi:polysaccharide chain length determinant protein (PEP-CTERM system associated)
MASSSLFADVAVLQDQLRGMWRFKWAALIAAWGAAIVLWGVIFMLPNKYEAKAKVFVDAGTTLSQATKGISLSDDVNDQIERMTATLLGTPQLRRVANETNLMAGAITPKQQQAVIDALRASITISAAAKQPSASPKSPTLFTITYTDPDRARSVQVVSHLLNDFVEGSLSDKTQGSQQAERFLTQQIADYGQRLSQTEQQLAVFKKRNLGLLPDEQGDYFSRLQAADSALRKLKGDLYVAQRQRDALAEELKSGQQFTASSSSSSPVSVAGAAALDTTQQIAQTQQRLDQMLLKYTDKYPDVIALKRTLKELQARQQREMTAARKGDATAASSLGLAANPVYQQIEVQYNSQQVQVASLEQQIVDRRQEIANLRASMGKAPEVQAQYAQLMRNYEVTKKQYDTLLSRLDSTRLGQQAASTGLVKFQVIDPPAANFEPVFPNRPLLIVGALFAALAAGGGLAYLMHLVRPVFVSARQLTAATGLTVLGSVSLAWVDQHRLEQRQGTIRYALWTGGLVLVGLVVLVLHAHISSAVREVLT